MYSILRSKKFAANKLHFRSSTDQPRKYSTIDFAKKSECTENLPKIKPPPTNSFSIFIADNYSEAMKTKNYKSGSRQVAKEIVPYLATMWKALSEESKSVTKYRY